MSIRVILADDHTLVRQSLADTINEELGMEVVGQAEDGMQVVDLVKEQAPDVVLMDINMPRQNGIDATREIMRHRPETRVVALSMVSSSRFVNEMFNAGATGYLLKDCDSEELYEAIRKVAEGEQYISAGIPGITQTDLDQSRPEKQDSAFSILTKRQRQVVQLLAEGKSTKQVALCMHLSPKTIEAHRLGAMRKLGLDTIAGLTKYAVQEGLTSLE